MPRPPRHQPRAQPALSRRRGGPERRGSDAVQKLLDESPVVIDTSGSRSEHERGEEFIRLFNELDHYVKQIVGSNGGEGFFRRLQWAGRDRPEIKRYIDDLLEYAELRNAMVHDRHFPNEMIAVPTEKLLADFRRLVERVVRPRRVLPEFGCSLRVFDAAEPLSAALEYMHREGFTQVVARQAGQLCLLTATGVTRWLAAHLGAPPRSDGNGGNTSAASCIDLAGATVADVLALENRDALALVPRGASVEDAVDQFRYAVANRRSRLYALLITEHGQPDEAPLGIITPADLLDEE